MPCEDATKLRHYICIQQAAIGLVQANLSLALLQRTAKNLDSWVAGVTGAMNFGLSILLIGRYGVHIYPSCSREVLYALSIGIFGNLLALFLVLLNGNEDPRLNQYLLFQGDSAAHNAFAVFFYITVYVTCLVSIGLATYYLIDVSDTQATDKHPKGTPTSSKKGKGSNPNIEIKVVPEIARRSSIKREDFFAEDDETDDGCEAFYPKMRSPSKSRGHNYTHRFPSYRERPQSQSSDRSRDYQAPRRPTLSRQDRTSRIISHHGLTNISEQARTPSHTSVQVEPMRPPTPPPPPPANYASRSYTATAKMINLKTEIADINNNRRNRSSRIPAYAIRSSNRRGS